MYRFLLFFQYYPTKWAKAHKISRYFIITPRLSVGLLKSTSTKGFSPNIALVCRITLLFLISNTFFACNSVTDKNIESTILIVDSTNKINHEKPLVEKELEFITDENVKEKLLAYGKENPETVVEIYTTKGKVTVKLFKDTPLHRANFIMMAKKGFYEGSVFTRVVKNFMAQGGGTYNEKQVDIKKQIGAYTIPNEINRKHIHKKGALGAARGYLSNPDKRSDPYAFYLVEGMIYPKEMLTHYEMKNNYTFSPEQVDYYTKNPGAAHIDGEHTVFGEIIEGFNVVPKLTNVRTDSRDWPHDDILIEKVVVVN